MAAIPSDPFAYDLAREITVQGTVTDLQVPESASEDVRFVLKRSEGTLEIQAGPWSRFQRQGWNLKNGDTVVVEGSRHHAFVRDIILAKAIQQGSRVLLLRDLLGKRLSAD